MLTFILSFVYSLTLPEWVFSKESARWRGVCRQDFVTSSVLTSHPAHATERGYCFNWEIKKKINIKHNNKNFVYGVRGWRSFCHHRSFQILFSWQTKLISILCTARVTSRNALLYGQDWLSFIFVVLLLIKLVLTTAVTETLCKCYLSYAWFVFSDFCESLFIFSDFCESLCEYWLFSNTFNFFKG